MPNDEFESETPTKPILVLTEEELEWAKVMRQRAATRNIRVPESAKLQWIPVIKDEK